MYHISNTWCYSKIFNAIFHKLTDVRKDAVIWVKYHNYGIALTGDSVIFFKSIHCFGLSYIFIFAPIRCLDMNTASLCIPQCTQRNMYISRATIFLFLLSLNLPVSPAATISRIISSERLPPASYHSLPALYSSISSIRSSPSREASGVTWTALMVPAIGELTTVSIFMAERTHSGWPFSTCKNCKHSSINTSQMYRWMNKTSWFQFGCLWLMKIRNLDCLKTSQNQEMDFYYSSVWSFSL